MSVLRNISILGSTGSIGDSALDVIARQSDQFNVVALGARRNIDKLFQQCQRHRPEYAVLEDESQAARLQDLLRQSKLSTQVLAGPNAMVEIAELSSADTVITGIVGAAGLMPTISAVKSGKRVLIANKEPLVMMGSLIMQMARENNAQIIPLDSEHNAIFQCVPEQYWHTRNQNAELSESGIRKIILTGSGGPFRDRPVSELSAVTPTQACAHPNWSMGEKISVDSATMMNKGLELIEAYHLFAVNPENIEIVVHPQSVIHSMVEYIDGSIIAQLGSPDMRIPIANALTWPARCESGAQPLNFSSLGRLDFEPPDEQKFPCLKLARNALNASGTAPVILNASNEIAVAAFLRQQISFTDIPIIIANTLDELTVNPLMDLQQVLRVDRQARQVASRYVTENKLNRPIAALSQA